MELDYTQAAGFTEHTGPSLWDHPEVKDKSFEDMGPMLYTAGFEELWSSRDEVYDEDEYVLGFRIKENATNEFGLAPYCAVVSTVCYTDVVYCANGGDFFALRLKLTRSTIRTNARLDELYEVAKKLFRAEHGHDHDEVCDHCDPRAAERLRAAARERQKRKAKAEAEAKANANAKAT